MTYWPSGKLSIGPRSTSFVLDVGERREHHEAEHGQREDAAERRAEADQRGLEELRARVRGKRLVGRGGHRSGLVGDRPRLRLDLGHVAADVARDVPRPEEPEEDREHGADHRDDPADDEPEEQARDSDREPDRPHARPGRMRGVGTASAHGGHSVFEPGVRDRSSSLVQPSADSIARRSRMSTT